MNPIVLILACVIAAQTLSAQEPLFNGTNLTGWKTESDGHFTITNGVLRVSGGKGWLRSEKTFGDFELDVEWRGLETNYNSGIFIRAEAAGKPWPTNVWQINTKQTSIGELLRGSSKIITNIAPIIPVNEWVKFHITARGKKLTLDVNGNRLWEFDRFEPSTGHIGFQSEGKAFEFRALKIQPVPEPEK